VILYADSSSILSIHLAEPGRHPVVKRAFEDADRVACSALALVEVQSGLARARFKDNPPRLDDAGYRRAKRDFNRDWRRAYGKVNLRVALITRAAELAEKHRVRAYDAIHLASALVLSGELPELVISTWDKELATAAQAEGLALAHEVTT
jgi:predicted nucleic acid-binding protein